MKKAALVFLLVPLVFAVSCSSVKTLYNPAKKYGKAELVKDFKLMREVLEEKHPSIYWYTSKDSMDMYFNRYESLIGDSMTELQFAWLILVPTVDKINCGHTSISMSKEYTRAIQNIKLPSFPLYFKVWSDTMAVTGTLLKNDSIFRRGTLITSINGIPNHSIIARMFNYLPQDGYANNMNYLRLSANFPYYHRNIFGLSKNYTLTYLDSTRTERTISVPRYEPPKPDTTKPLKKIVHKEKKIKPTKEEILKTYRSLKIDSTGKYAIMELNGFTKGGLRKFFKQSFKELNKKNVPNLVLDIRNNGGGRVGLSTLLTKYLIRTSFKVADTVFANSQSLGKYTKYANHGLLNNLQLLFTSKKYTDGRYHMRYFEKHTYKPKQQNHFDGKVYVITSGPTFSAASIVCNLLKGQKDITLVGEETGGGWYGNSGILIPDITLPNTHVRFRLPLFRVVQYHHPWVKGTGIPPDVFIGPSYDAIIKGYDQKMKKVLWLINSQ